MTRAELACAAWELHETDRCINGPTLIREGLAHARDGLLLLTEYGCREAAWCETCEGCEHLWRGRHGTEEQGQEDCLRGNKINPGHPCPDKE